MHAELRAPAERGGQARAAELWLMQSRVLRWRRAVGERRPPFSVGGAPCASGLRTGAERLLGQLVEERDRTLRRRKTP